MIFVFLRFRESLFAEHQVSASNRFDTILDFKSSLFLPEQISVVSSAKMVESVLMLFEKSYVICYMVYIIWRLSYQQFV